MPMNRFFWLAFACLLLISGCSTMEVMRDDPLIGKIYTGKSQSEISYTDLLKRMSEQNIIYLGESHDNPEHHRIQLQILKDLIQGGKKPHIGFEFFSRDQTAYLMTYIGSKPKQGDRKRTEEKRLRYELGWQDKEDTTWKFYFDLIDLAQEHGLSVFGADLPKGLIRRLMRQDITKLSPVERGQLHSTHLDDSAYQALMFDKFKAAHCGFAHKEMMEKMYQTWLERNDAMATSIVETHRSDPEQPVVMIVGSGHIEHNLGIYERVAVQIQNIRQLNLGIKEITIDPSPLPAYFATEKIDDRVFQARHEILWFTQRSSYQDPCKRFHKALKAMKQKTQPPP